MICSCLITVSPTCNTAAKSPITLVLMSEPDPKSTFQAAASKRRQPWRPTKHLLPSQPPRDEQIKEEIYNNSVAAAEQWGGALDFAGRAPKRLKPRRTVDYSAEAARWQTVSLISREEAVWYNAERTGLLIWLILGGIATQTSIRTIATTRSLPRSLQHVQGEHQ